jgi:signal transduction histidine kinase
MTVQDDSSLTHDTRVEARFMAGMAHELRTPLNAIIGFAEMLAGGMAPDPRRQVEFAGHILVSARLLLQQINSLVELARADSGLLKLNRQPADLAGLVADTLRVVQPAALRRNVRITSRLDGAPALVTLDASRIMHALHGLLGGVIAMAGEGQEITLRITSEGEGSVRLELEGVVVGSGQTAELIVPKAGAWLGLSLARGIVEAHGGKLGITRTSDRRTILHAVLPGAMAGAG